MSLENEPERASNASSKTTASFGDNLLNETHDSSVNLETVITYPCRGELSGSPVYLQLSTDHPHIFQIRPNCRRDRVSHLMWMFTSALGSLRGAHRWSLSHYCNPITLPACVSYLVSGSPCKTPWMVLLPDVA